MTRLKRLVIAVAMLCMVAACSFACACTTVEEAGALKELTDPYITMYECKEATYGGENFLVGFEYIRITLLDNETMELSFKKQGEKAQKYTCPYSFDEKTGELMAEGGAAGVRFKERILIENGKFTISFPIMEKQLVMRFES